MQNQIKQSLEEIRSDNIANRKELIGLEKEFSILENKLQDPFKVIKDFFELGRTTLQGQYEKECALYEEQNWFLQ